MIESALVDWSRAQFALTACYHWIFVPLTLGLSVIMAIMETLYVIRKVDFWKHAATKVASMKKAKIPSMASGAPNMSPTNHE